MSSSPLVRAAVQGLLSGLAAASASACAGASSDGARNAPAVVVPVETVKEPAPIATVSSPPSKVEPVVRTKPRERDYDCCRGKNDCKGQSGCATSFNDCAGLNECKAKGTSCPPGQPGDR